MRIPPVFLLTGTLAVLAVAAGCKPEEPPSQPLVPKVKAKDADLNSPDLLPSEAGRSVPAPRPAPVVATPTDAPPTTQNPGLEKIEDLLPTAPPGSAKTNPVDRKLTEALHHYLEAKNKLPQDFGALITARILKEVPKPPPGKRFAIDRQNLQVVIID